MKIFARLFALILLALLFSVACAQQATPTPRVITVVVTAIPEPSATPTVFATATVKPTRTPAPTYTPNPPWSPPPTQTPFILKGNNPSDWDIARFVLDQHHPNLRPYYELAEAKEYSEFTRQDMDVNGDSYKEIVIKGRDSVSDEAYFGVVRYDSDSNSWHDMFFLEDFSHLICHDMQITLESDHIVIDEFSCDFGSAFSGYQWWQTWIECNKEICAKIWSAQLLGSSQNDGKGFPCNSNYFYSKIERPNSGTIRFTIHHFGIDGISCYETPLGMVRRIVGPEIVETFRWDGSQYGLVSREQAEPGLEIAREFDQETDETMRAVIDILSYKRYIARESSEIDLYGFWGVPSPDSADASAWKSEYSRPVVEAAVRDSKTDKNFAGIVAATDKQICRLTVQRYESDDFTLIGRIDVPCTSNFTRLFWEDIDADGEDELLLLTISAGSEDRQLYVYRVDKQLIEITKITGVINGADGVGIKWENTPEGFRLFVGLPFADTSAEKCSPDWNFSCASLTRRFQTYRWDKTNNQFVPVLP